jgi:dTDP-4-amino-4,6-dideoxygalactose transaminase
MKVENMIPPIIVPITSKEICSALRTCVTDDTTVSEFERGISEYIDCKNSILTYSGRTALYVLLKAYGLKKSDEIIMPAYMCETVSQLLIDMGFRINFVDIEKDTYNINIEDLMEKVSKSTKAIIPVHMFGNPCEMKSILEIANDYDLIVIEDAAQAMGAEYHGKKVGVIGDSGFFSFGRGKPITTMDGGAIVTNDDKIAEKSREIISAFKKQKVVALSMLVKLLGYSSLRNRTIYRLIYKIVRNDNLRGDINISNLGFKFSNIQASIGLVQLSRLDEFNKSRTENAKFLREHLERVKGIKLQRISKNAKPIYLRFPIRVDTKVKRDRVISDLNKSGIESSVVYPVALPQFHGISDECKNTEEAVKKTIALPTHPCVEKTDLERIIVVLKEIDQG